MLAEFVHALAMDGQVHILRDAPDAGGLDAALAALDAEWREELAGEAPPLDPAVAAWAAKLMYDSCRFIAFRDIDAQAVAEAFAERPVPDSPEVLYSADLCLRFLPDVLRLARTLSTEDPLTRALAQLAVEWPLSSLGAEDIEAACPVPVRAHPCLFQLYLDRLVERKDHRRMKDPALKDALARLLGGFPELSAEWPEALREELKA